MGFIEGQGRNQGTLFPVALDDLVPADEIGLATMAYNLKRITNVLGATKLTEALHHA